MDSLVGSYTVNPKDILLTRNQFKQMSYQLIRLQVFPDLHSLTFTFPSSPSATRSDVDGVLRRANDTEYGLASGVFTRDINKAMYVSERLDAGTVFVNTYNKTDVASPFGGFKQSGFGKDLGELTRSA